MDDPGGDELERALTDARSGGVEGLTVLFRAFHPRMLRYVRARERGAADDIAGETWIAVAQRIGTFDGNVGAFVAWLFTIARQRLADRRRTEIRRATDPAADVPEVGGTRSPEEHALDDLGAQDAVDFIVRTLTADQADVVLLRVLGGLTAADVAALTGRGEGWVRVTHHRAIRRLREAMPNQEL